MTQILNNALYLISGMIAGLILGWTLSSMRYAKQARDIANKLREERGWYSHKISLGIVLILTAIAAIWTGFVNTNQQKSQQCTERAVAAIVQSLNERTGLSSQLSLADSEQNKAFSIFVGALLSQPQPSKKIMRNLFEDYVAKLHHYLGLQDSQRTTQAQNPFPKSVDYKACLED